MNQETTETRRIPLDLLDPSPTNPRTHFDPTYIESLADNFIEHTHPGRGIHGIKQDLLVRPRAGGRLEIVTGECRFRGAKLAVEIATQRDLPDVAKVLAAVPCRVEQLSDREVLEIQLVENVKRTDLTPVEEARGYQRLLDLRETDGTVTYTVALIARQVGKSERSIYEKLTLLRAPKVIIEALEAGLPGIGERHAVLLARIPDPQLRDEAAKKVMEGVSEWDGAARSRRTMTVGETRTLLREHYMVSLKGAPWKMEDADLESGPCATCPHLAKNFTELTDDLAATSSGKGGKGGIDPLTCCNPACRDRKMKAFFDREAKALKASGGKVLSQKEAKAIFYQHGALHHAAPYVPLDSKPGYEFTGKWDDKNVPSYEQLAKKLDAKPVIALAMSPKGEVVRLLGKKAAHELAHTLKAKGGLAAAAGKKTLTHAEQREREKRLRADRIATRTKTVALKMLAEHIQQHPMGLEECFGRLKLALWHAGIDGCRLVCDWLGCKPEKPKKGAGQMAKDYADVIVEHLVGRGTALPELAAIEAVCRVAKEVKQWPWPPQGFEILAGAHGFDVERVRAKATEEIDAEAAAKAEKKAARNGPPSAKPPSRSKSASASRNASVNDSDERTRDKLAHDKPTGAAGERAFDDQVAMARKGATWPEILGPRPKEGTPEFKSWTARRVKVWKAARKAMGTK